MTACFVCLQPADHTFRWTWSQTDLGVCEAHRPNLVTKARQVGQRVPQLTAVVPPEQPEATRPGVKSAALVAGAPPSPASQEQLAQVSDSVALIRIFRAGDGFAFQLRRPGQHDVDGSTQNDLLTALVGLGYLKPTAVASPAAARTVGPGGPVSGVTHPGQMTPPGAASALAGAAQSMGSTRQARPPVNPPAPAGMFPPSRHLGTHQPPPLGAVGSVQSAPTGQPPTPPPVAPPWGAPVPPDASPAGDLPPNEPPNDGTPPETSETVVE